MSKPTSAQAADLILVKQYILLPLILSAYERDQRIINESGLFKTPDIYSGILEIGLNAVTEELRYVRKGLRNRGIKIYEEIRNEDGIRANYLCRGYHHTTSLSWSLITAEAKVLMRKYLGIDVRKYEDITVPEDARNKY